LSFAWNPFQFYFKGFFNFLPCSSSTFISIIALRKIENGFIATLHQGHGAGFDLISYLTQNISDLFAQFYDKLLKFFLDMNLSPLPKIIMWVRNSGPSTAGPSL